MAWFPGKEVEEGFHKHAWSAASIGCVLLLFLYLFD